MAISANKEYYITQIRYFGDTNRLGAKSDDQIGSGGYFHINCPVGLTAAELSTGSAFYPYTPIVQLGVQALPGTMFMLNGSQDPIIIGASGMFELDLYDTPEKITKLEFTLGSLEAIDQNPDGYLLIDILRERNDG